MKIGELATQSGVPASTIRFYEQKGLMPKAARSNSGYRHYDDSALHHLQLIKFSQSLGFSLDELPQLMDINGAWDHDVIMQRLKRKEMEVDALLAQLVAKKQRIASLIGRLSEHWDKGQCMPADQLACQISDIDVTSEVEHA